ncbi:MAG: hypothetical protein ACPGSD_04860 [Flavobacteriales bacterium]
MKILKRVSVVIVSLLVFHTITFYTISDCYLVREVGRNYESYFLGFEGNEFNNIGVISKMNLKKEIIKENFKSFRLHKIQVCTSITDCKNLRKTDSFYLYLFNIENRNPFKVNALIEGELADGFGASWESKYIWFLWKWILLEKTNTGIS